MFGFFFFFRGDREEGETLMSNLTQVAVIPHAFVFVFSWQGGGLQKWKPLTQSPEPQRYNPPHPPLFVVLTLSGS